MGDVMASVISTLQAVTWPVSQTVKLQMHLAKTDAFIFLSDLGQHSIH